MRLSQAGFWLLGIALFVIVAIVLEDRFGVPFDTSYRLGCIGVCLSFMVQIGREYPGERWPWFAVAIAGLANIAIMMSPLVDRPASRGELMIFALPDVAIFLATRAVTYPAKDVHQRAIRGQLILGFILALAFSAIVLSLGLIPDDGPRRTSALARPAST